MRWRWLLPILLLVQWPADASADLLDALNAVRARGCSGTAGSEHVLGRSTLLDQAARALAQSRDLGAAMSASAYRATSSAAISVRGPLEPAALSAFVAERYCNELANPVFREIGWHRQDDTTWIILAAPFDAPSPAETRNIGARVLQLVNAARDAPRRCGNRSFAATAALRSNAALEAAARAHATSMATYDYLEHTGRDGSTVGDRVARAGYRWRAVGENIAGGPTTAEAVVEGWLMSPGHCANIMAPQFSEIGIAFELNRQSRLGIYWTQVFGAPR